MPHLWMFLLQALTPPEHEVLLIDGNAQRMDEEGIAQFVREQQIGLVGIGAMTRMIQKAYRMADAIRAAGVPVVMGGPHVTEVPDEALGRNPKLASSLYGRGLAKLEKGDAAGGEADIAAAKAIQANIAEEFARYGVTPVRATVVE